MEPSKTPGVLEPRWGLHITDCAMMFSELWYQSLTSQAATRTVRYCHSGETMGSAGHLDLDKKTCCTVRVDPVFQKMKCEPIFFLLCLLYIHAHILQCMYVIGHLATSYLQPRLTQTPWIRSHTCDNNVCKVTCCEGSFPHWHFYFFLSLSADWQQTSSAVQHNK